MDIIHCSKEGFGVSTSYGNWIIRTVVLVCKLGIATLQHRQKVYFSFHRLLRNVFGAQMIMLYS